MLRITLDIFSGRENPVIELKGREAQDALKRLRPERKLRRGEIGLPPVPTLGYRGLVIEQTDGPVQGLPIAFRLAHGDMFGPGLAHRASDPDFEDFFCGSAGPLRKLKLGSEFPRLVKKEIERFRFRRLRWPLKKSRWPFRLSCRCAPLYEPDWWNDPARRPHNNCYNYATNYRTDTFAQPGLAAGAKWTALTCAAVKAAATKDDLIDRPAANNKCPREGHLVALAVWPNPTNPNTGYDYHWYRKGRNGYWSHKPGGTNATNLDNSGHTITDPRTADRGSYTNFCTFMVVMHGHIKIK